MKIYTILIIEDDEDASDLIKNFLYDCGFKVETFMLASDAIASMRVKKYDLLLLDLNLPDFDGFEVLKAMKNSITIPTIVISAYSDINTKLRAFRLGALDYIVKPYNMLELEARIWTSFIKSTPFVNTQDGIFEIENNNVVFRDEKLKLTQIESDILKVLISNKNNTVSRETLSASLSTISSQRSLDYHIKNIRKKICDDSSNPKYLKTEYGMGYILNF